MKKIIWAFLRFINIGGCVQLMLKSALSEDGWFRSFNTKQSVDKNGNPIPWYTYSSIRFIEVRLKKEFDVFEYGSGNSTLWYADRVRSIRSVDHDEKWAEYISKKCHNNTEIVFKHLEYGGEYSREISADGKKYHIIVIDGRDRNNCVKNCINSLTPDGIIIFDNTQVPEYKEAIDILLSTNFKRIDFIGILPIIADQNTTSIFYRKDNCFNI